MNAFDVLVIGEGVAGLTAANEAARRGARTATFEAGLFGGLITNINHLDPSPDAAGKSGAELAAALLEANVQLGVESIGQSVNAVTRDDNEFVVRAGAADYRSRRIVIASGARPRLLGIPGEAALTGRGVSTMRRLRWTAL